MGSAIGIDVGGTRARGFLVADDGRVLGEELVEMPADDVDASLDTLYRLASAVAADGQPSAVGIGSAGMVDFEAGVIRFSPMTDPQRNATS